MLSDFWRSIGNLAQGKSLDAAGLVALADLSTIQRRTALTGTTTWLDALVLCPGLHRQQSADTLHGGERPTLISMESGYMFTLENQATVMFLQKISRTGHLTTVETTNVNTKRLLYRLVGPFFTFPTANLLSAALYFIIVALNATAMILLAVAYDWWGFGVLAVLVLSRLCNIYVIKARNELGWKGANEPGKMADNLVLLSQDRWVRMKGPLNDVKAVTAGQWLRDPTFFEGALTAVGTVLVYMDAALASNVDQGGKITLLFVLLVSVGLLSVVNECTTTLFMNSCILSVTGQKRYERRLAMMEAMVRECGKEEWALREGYIVAPILTKQSPTPAASPVKLASSTQAIVPVIPASQI